MVSPPHFAHQSTVGRAALGGNRRAIPWAGREPGGLSIADLGARPKPATLATKTYELVTRMAMDHRIGPDMKVKIGALAHDSEVSRAPFVKRLPHPNPGGRAARSC